MDCAVVGAGFTGLALARRLHELRPGWRIAVVDAQRAGTGASGRASGFVVDLVDFTAALDAEDRARYVRVARAGIAELRRLVAELGIDCWWDETGWMRAARGPRGMRFLSSWPRLLEDFEIAYRWLDSAELSQVIGSEFYQAAVRLPGSILIHPGRLVRGLAAALPPAVDLYECSPVLAIERGASFELTTPGGRLVADKLFVTANGYSQALGFGARQIFPVFTFGSFTRPLSEAEQASIGGEREWGILAMDPMGSTVRRLRDGRLLIRNTVHYTRGLRLPEAVLEKARREHRRALLARFPSLAEVGFESTWSGLMGTSRTRLYTFGELEPGLFLAGGFTGAGIAQGAIVGRLLAELALGEDSALLRDQLALPSPFRMPVEPLRSMGGWWLVQRMNHAAGDCL
ncbi:MAG: FAD-binding oxidoreductase [Thermoanaerobaculia bacterium]